MTDPDFLALLIHRATVRRPVTTNDSLKNPIPSYSDTGAGVRCRVIPTEVQNVVLPSGDVVNAAFEINFLPSQEMAQGYEVEVDGTKYYCCGVLRPADDVETHHVVAICYERQI